MSLSRSPAEPGQRPRLGQRDLGRDHGLGRGQRGPGDPGQAGGGPAGGRQHQGRGGHGHALDHVVGLGHHGAPVPGRGGRQRGGHHPAAGGVQRGGADQQVVHHRERRHDVHALDHRGALAGAAVDEVDVAPGPAQRQLHHQPATVAGQLHRGPRPLVRQVAEHQLVVARVVAQHVPPDRAVVIGLLLAHGRRIGVAGVGEGPAVRGPGHRARPGAGDAIGQHLAGGHVDDAQRAALVAAEGRAEGDEPAVVRGRVPVERGGGVAGQLVGVEQGAGRGHPVAVDVPDHQHRLLVAGPAVDREQPPAPDRRRPGPARGVEGAEPLDQAGPVGPGVDHRPGAGVVRRHPGPGVGGVAVLQPAVGVGHLHAVVHVDDVVAARGRSGRRRHRRGQRALGLRRWLAFLRRAFARRLAVFFDMAERLAVPRQSRSSPRSLERGTAATAMPVSAHRRSSNASSTVRRRPRGQRVRSPAGPNRASARLPLGSWRTR